jgi:hypothetical protein
LLDVQQSIWTAEVWGPSLKKIAPLSSERAMPAATRLLPM